LPTRRPRWTTTFGVRAPQLGLAVLIALGSFPAGAAEPRPNEAALMSELRAWISAQRPEAAAGIEVVPIDSRVQVPRCEPRWVFDHPFATAEVVRARCSATGTQFYLRTRPPAGAGPQGPQRSPRALAAPTAVVPAAPGALEEAPRAGSVPAAQTGPAVQSMVTTRIALARGTRLMPGMVEVSERVESRPGMAFLSDPGSVVDMEVTRDVRPGEALRPADIRPAVLVRRGEAVTLEVGQAPGLSIRARLEALQDGRRGETIKLINRESGKILTGVVTGANQAESR
jgi:flagella basal body P-ring formation protein FlgA